MMENYVGEALYLEVLYEIKDNLNITTWCDLGGVEIPIDYELCCLVGR